MASFVEMKSAAIFLFFFSMLHVAFLPQTTARTTTIGANETDRLALLAFKSKIIFDPQGVMSSWNDSLHFCRWEGVLCSHRHATRVSGLYLPSRGLVGSLSPHIGNLSFLRSIHAPNNSFSGGIPPEMGRLFRLEYLGLPNNSLEGIIPANLSHCTNLNFLQLGGNTLVGKIPNSFSSLLKLKFFGIPFNNLSSGIPPFIGNLTSLERLSLAYCHLVGSIPDAFHKLTILKELLLGANDLTGIIPSSIYNLSSLETLDLSENHLRGSVLASLPLMLPSLQVLGLRQNNFTGFLRPSISNFSELQILDMSVNDFSGKVAVNFGKLQNLTHLFVGGNNFGSGDHDEFKFIDSLSNCSKLEALDLGNNNFRGMLPVSLGNFSSRFNILRVSVNSIYGSLPSSVGHLSSLRALGLRNNQIGGMIPHTIGNLRNIQQLIFGGNDFSGAIPDSFGNLSLLLTLSIENNKLEGTIPSSLGNCHSLNALSLYNNNLSGNVPKEIFELSSLSYFLNLGRNHLSGSIPVEVGGLKNLGQLAVGQNYMSGELPSSLGSCISLELLDLSGNFFQGPLPTSLSSLRALQTFDLSRNNFSGPIPEYLAEIPFEILNISFNDFEGEVPREGVFANSSKISVVGNHRLCGGLFEFHLPNCNSKHSKGRQKLSVALILVISIASAFTGVALVSFFLLCWCRKKGHGQPVGLESKEPFLKISYEKLHKATDGFSSENLIGIGSFASVYKGILDENDFIVAVKVLNLQHQRGFKSFITECEALRHVRHRNLVRVITCCSSIDFQGNDFKALVYEFMSNGSLEQWLHSYPTTSNELPRLNLVQRIKIAIDVACALDYLHHQSENCVIHCDLKPSNILLDEDMVAHVGDFGIARILLPELSNARTNSTTGIIGTIGYAPPEYGIGNEVSTAGDVYSYGILLLEMLTGKKPIDPLFQEGLNLHKYARAGLSDCELEIVEPCLLSQNNKECLISMLKIGVLCSMELPQDRMDISRVIHDLRVVANGMH